MTEPAEQPAETPAEAETKAKVKRGLLWWAGIVLAVLAALVVVVLVGGRLAVLSPAGRDLVQTFVAGKKLGRYGRINVYGLRGDLWDDFTLERVTVTDAQGVWLDARDVRVDWSYWALVTRRFHATDITVRKLQVLRRPEVEPRLEPPGPLPLGIDIDRFRAEVELFENFSQEYGRFNVDGALELTRVGDRRGQFRAVSVTRPGDRLEATFALGEDAPIELNARAHEARGGPIAGAFGFSPDEPFLMNITLDDRRLNAIVRSGRFTPLYAQGRWDDEGARVSGRMVFEGSDLLEPFAERLGREARFGMAAIHQRGDIYAVGWVLRADNLTTRAQGLINRQTRRSSQGLTLRASTPNLARLSGQNIAGPASLNGLWRGEPDRWRFVGRTTLAQVQLAGYQADVVTGPVEIIARNGRFDVDADLRADGGRARGVIGGLLGAQPRLQFQGARLADGRTLFERVILDGSAFHLDGRGSRGVTGALSFQGDAIVEDFSRIRRAGSGRLDLDFSASKRSQNPWSFRIDARGRRLHTGMAQLDRLLGETPRLRGQGVLSEGRLAISQSELTGQSGRLGARGFLGLGGRDTRLLLDWDASGPFGIGPIEVVGEASGQGALTGTLNRPIIDLTANISRLDAGPLPLTDADLTLRFRRGANGSDGRFVLTADSRYGPARASSDFRFGGGGVALNNLDVAAGGVVAQGDVALNGRTPSSADLTFTARPGAFITSGQADGVIRLSGSRGDAQAMVDVRATDVRLAGSDTHIRRLSLQGQGTLERLPFRVSADVRGATPVIFEGTGLYSRQGQAQSVALEGSGRIRDIAFRTRAPAVFALADGGRVVRANLEVGGGALIGELRQDQQGAVLQADLSSVDLASLTPDLRGRITGRVSLRGRGDDLSGSVTAQLQDARSRDTGPGVNVDANVEAILLNNRLEITATAANGGDARSELELSLPVRASAAPLRLAVARDAPIRGQVTLNGEIQPIWDLVLGGERSLSGQVNGRAAIGGTLIAPELDGRLDLTQGRFRDAATGLTLTDVTASATFDRGSATLETFSAGDGDGGRATGSGRLGLREGSASNLTLQLTSFKVIDNDLAEAQATGPITVTRGRDGRISLEGRLEVNRAEISADLPTPSGVVTLDVVEINRPGGDEEPRERPRGRGFDMALDVTLRADDEIYLRGRGLDIEMSLNARVRGTLSDPILTGRANVIRGDYEFAGKRFIIDERGSVSLSTDPNNIRLDLRAVREDPTLTAEVRVSGTAARPIITLGSTPSLPQDEILAQVLFGRSASQLSALEAAQLASSVASLAGGGGFDVLGNLREFAGLDRLSFGGEASGMTIAGGKYLSDDVYFEIIGGAEGAAVQVEWRARRNVAVVSRLSGDGDNRLSIRWRRESERPGRNRRERTRTVPVR
ncbi:translocation/assembly module TamB domain-containing protein [Brevundimonas sp. 2R-24]|uniref:Translocation/assembly module TamB domain-containing protein n=1 Tax=Peiella sedimenti TaxID=3061083 RepID=A0ABT8SJJ9_9CAUL|nr:translocation/assembly module TamB domain-containing protein [Caulobacteraceae bacterium XZ-24]